MIAIAALINRTGTIVLFFLSYYLLQPRFGFSLGEVGFISFAFGFGALLTAPLSGWLSDKIGALQVMKLSLVLSGTILLIYPLGQNFVLIASLTFLCALTAEAFRPASYAILNVVVAGPDEMQTLKRRKSAQALYRLAVNLGFAIGPLIGGFLATRGLWEVIFLVDGASSILAFVYLSVMLRPVKFQPSSSGIHATESAIIQSPTTKAIADRRFRYFLAAMAPALLVFFLEMGALPQFMKLQLGIDESFFGYLIALNAFLVIVLELPLNWFTRAWSYRRSLTWGALLVALGFGSVAFANSFLFIALTVVIWTFGEMFLLPNSFAYVGSIAPKNRQGEYAGILAMVFNLCLSLAPWLGLLALSHIPRLMWVAAFVLGGLSAVMISRMAPTATESISSSSN